jgi:hypothetical protein
MTKFRSEFARTIGAKRDANPSSSDSATSSCPDVPDASPRDLIIPWPVVRSHPGPVQELLKAVQLRGRARRCASPMTGSLSRICRQKPQCHLRPSGGVCCPRNGSRQSQSRWRSVRHRRTPVGAAPAVMVCPPCSAMPLPGSPAPWASPRRPPCRSRSLPMSPCPTELAGRLTTAPVRTHPKPSSGPSASSGAEKQEKQASPDCPRRTTRGAHRRARAPG